MSAKVDLSIIIVNWNTRDLLAQCLQSLQDTVEASLEVWVVDNNSADDSVDVVRERFPQTRLITNAENVGFVRANNQALSRCQGRYVLLLNSDTQALPGSLDEALRFMDQHPQAGLAGVRLVNADGSFQASFTPFPNLWREFLILSGLGRWLIRPTFPSHGPQVETGTQRINGYVEGAFMLARRAAVEQVGGLDEGIFMYAEDVDWCYRFYRAGWELWYLPHVPIVHYGGQSTKKRPGRMEAELYRSRIYFFRKHYGKVAAASLKALIYGATLFKMALHKTLCLVTRGRKGRTIATWQELRAALSDSDLTLGGEKGVP
jgi:GT2 family glycosyltransferase